MTKNLLIVESPAKAKTIEKYLGKDFTVKSSYGHVRDLVKGNDGVDVDDGFKPKYVVSKEKEKVVKELKSWVKKVDEVWLATDEDREGEAISWHLCEVLGLDASETKRIVFHEITKPAIKNAIEEPRTVNIDLVNAQQARRILDRLVGFELSSLLWKKVRGRLSAGRVQSVAVKLIVEREREIQNFKPVVFYRVTAEFDLGNAVLKATLPSKIETEKAARDFLDKCNGASFSIADIKVRPSKRKPAAPFITSTLQQEASRKLGFSVSRTMSNAQRLYEQGFISYMRTDSVNLSETALKEIASHVSATYGDNYLETRRYKTKKANAQEAHEAIRPTYVDKQVVTTDNDQQRLYELIWKRTIASQMAEAKLEKTTAVIAIDKIPDQNLEANGEVIVFDGFMKVYIESEEESNSAEQKRSSSILPPLKVGQDLELMHMEALERHTKAPARFSEATLVKKMEELGIGRPSTYAPTINKITEQSRGYVQKLSKDGDPVQYTRMTLKNGSIEDTKKEEMAGAAKNRLFATDMGALVVDFLDEHFNDIMTYNFTAEIEERFDEIAGGKEQWADMISSFYVPFHKTVDKTLNEAERATGERILGKDPETGRTLLVRMSKFGAVAQIGAPDELEEDEKPKYANLRNGQKLETITEEEAIKLFELPKVVGQFEGKDLVVAVGRYGPYVKYDEQFISIPRLEDPLEVTSERAIELVLEKRKADMPIASFDGLPVTQGKGRFGPFLKWNEMYINIPRRYDPDNLTPENIDELIQAKKEKEANRYIHNWVEEKISVENARWGPIIKVGKKTVRIPKKEDGKRVTPEEAAEWNLEQVIAMVKDIEPGLIKEKKPKKPKAKSKSKAKPKK